MFKRKNIEIHIPYIEVIKEMCSSQPRTILYDEDMKRSVIGFASAIKPIVIDDSDISKHLSQKYINHQITVTPILNKEDEIDDVQIIVKRVRKNDDTIHMSSRRWGINSWQW